MAQTASALSTEQSLYISQDEPAIGAVASEEIKSPFRHDLKFVDTPVVFTYGSRSRFRFDIAADQSQYFALIRGLIDFNRSKELTFTFLPESRSFETDIDSIQQEQLDSLLLLVNSLLAKEIRFKSKLKEVIRFEEEYREQKEKVYSSFL